MTTMQLYWYPTEIHDAAWVVAFAATSDAARRRYERTGRATRIAPMQPRTPPTAEEMNRVHHATR